MKNHFYIILLLLPFYGKAQTSRLRYAEKQYEALAYYYAAEGFEDVLDRGYDSMELATKIVDCYDKINNVEKAVQWYDYIEQKGQLSQTQLLRSAVIRRQLGDYSNSSKLASTYLQKYGEHEVINEILNEQQKANFIDPNKSNFSIKEQSINSKFSEISSSYIDEQKVLVAKSGRKAFVKRIYSWTGEYYYNLYTSSIDKNGEIGKLKKVKGDVNTKFHDGPACYDSLNQWIYFTRNNVLNNKKETDANNVMRLKLYRAKLDGEKYTQEEELPFNNNEYSCAHPAISADGKTLYFSSDQPGGYGGSDIYKVSIQPNGTFGKPENLGNKVNSPLNEFTPFYNSAENILFFSSEGHHGFGGLDVFVAKLDKTGQVKSIANLGEPINSKKDDFSFVQNSDQTNGYFASNRENGAGLDDLFGFKQTGKIKNSPVVKGIITDTISNAPLANATVYLFDQNGAIVDSLKSDPEGNYEFELIDLENSITVSSNFDGYLPSNRTIQISQSDSTYQADLALRPDLNYYLFGSVADKETSELLDNVKITIMDKSTNTTIGNYTSDLNGFKTPVYGDWKYGDTKDLEFKFEKKGYVTLTVPYNQHLATTEGLEINKSINPSLTKIIENETDLNDVIAINPIYFDYNKYAIRADAAVELDKVVKVMMDNPGMVIELKSHTDSRGNDQSNFKLSDNRAKSSAAYIVSKGISKDRIIGKGYGEKQLIVSDKKINEANTIEEKERLHQLNRRTEFIIRKMK